MYRERFFLSTRITRSPEKLLQVNHSLSLRGTRRKFHFMPNHSSFILINSIHEAEHRLSLTLGHHKPAQVSAQSLMNAGDCVVRSEVYVREADRIRKTNQLLHVSCDLEDVDVRGWTRGRWLFLTSTDVSSFFIWIVMGLSECQHVSVFNFDQSKQSFPSHKHSRASFS